MGGSRFFCSRAQAHLGRYCCNTVAGPGPEDGDGLRWLRLRGYDLLCCSYDIFSTHDVHATDDSAADDGCQDEEKEDGGLFKRVRRGKEREEREGEEKEEEEVLHHLSATDDLPSCTNDLHANDLHANDLHANDHQHGLWRLWLWKQDLLSCIMQKCIMQGVAIGM